MATILFSITVDNTPEILKRQIENINFFCPGSYICIHVAQNAEFPQQELDRFVDFPNVIINPASYEVIRQKGCLHAHVSNFGLAIEKSVAFDKIVLFSSDDLLLRFGLSDYLNKHHIGSQIELYDPSTTYDNWLFFREELLSDTEMKKFLATVGLPIFAGGQAEGQFFSKEIFLTIERIFRSTFPMAPCGFPTEQVVPQTIAMRVGMNGVNVALPITFIDHNSRIQFTDDYLHRIIAGTGAIYANGKPRAIRPIHIGSCVLKDIFAISCTDSEGYDPWPLLQNQRQSESDINQFADRVGSTVAATS